MSTTSNVDLLATAIGTDVKALLAKLGDLTSLNTTEKSNLVGAINELIGQIASASGIDDNSTGTSASWSAAKVQAELDALKAALEDGSPLTLDTFNELAAAINDDPDFYNTINTLVTNNANAISTLSANVGDTSTDFVATYTAARDAA